jgi:hypothetical protein
MCYFFPFVSTLTSRFKQNLKKCSSREKQFFSSLQGWGHSGWYLPSKQPLAATQVAASGCKWLQVAANNANGCKRRCSGNFKSYQ